MRYSSTPGKCVFKSIMLLLITLIGGHISFCQVDSLLKALKKHGQNDTIQLNLLLGISHELIDTQPELAMTYARQAITLGRQLKTLSKVAQGYSLVGVANFYRKQDRNLAMAYMDTANIWYAKTGDKKGMAIILNKKGQLYYKAQDYQRSSNAHQEAIKLFGILKDTVWLANSINSIGINQYRLNNYAAALDSFFVALRWQELVKNIAGQAGSLGNIGLIYEKQGKFQLALECQQKALRLHQQAGDKPGTANTLDHIGTLYDGLELYDSSLAYYRRALSLNTELKRTLQIAGNTTNIGIVQISNRQYTAAFNNLQEAYTMYSALGETRNHRIILSSLGDLFQLIPDEEFNMLGMLKKNKYAVAEGYYKQSIEQSIAEGDQYALGQNYIGLANVLEMQSKYKDALMALKKYSDIKDSLFTDESKEAITRSALQYEFEKKEAVAKAVFEQQQALQISEIKRQKLVKNGAITIGSILLASGLGLFVFYKRKRDATLQSREADVRATIASTELKALRAQMNPHFIFNSLNSIADYIDRQDPKAATAFTTRFAKLMRLILENSEKKEVCLADELKALELYMQLEAQRMNHKFTYEISIDEELDPEETLIPPLLLQPFVENSIWHGISKKEGTGHINIRIQKEGEMINCIVEDNGVGRLPKDPSTDLGEKPAKQSLGMKITQSRIDILNKLKNSNAGLQLTDLSQGLRVELRLPLELSF